MPNTNESARAFESLGISPAVLGRITRLGFKQPTPIQLQSIPHVLEGKDLIGIAQTGTGKTGAFMVPILTKLGGGNGIRVLVLAPTRELALQIHEMTKKLAEPHIRIVTLIGGAAMRPQEDALRRRPDIVIATPGRLIDHLNRKTIRLETLRVLVLDEADRMLDMGFLPQVTRILDHVPKERQTMLFSATMPNDIVTLSSRYMLNPVQVAVARSGETATRVTQEVFEVARERKLDLLLHILKQNEGKTALVFVRTKHGADKIARILFREGVSVTAIHSNRSLNQRLKALEGFRRGVYRVLIATDIASRGIDVANINLVVNFDMPHVAEDYVHRIGRTARVAATGHAMSFVSGDERPQLRAIERLIQKEIPRGAMPEHIPALPPAIAHPSRPAVRRFGGRRFGGRGGSRGWGR
ncbi:MAG: hypothetical protein A3G64_01040 [Candidatus Liptonbacteria bacterium RIFCSPLOWO2_12_FULL_60_15]|uniref:DEAD/DEAH box helicase n=2 Tax=Candidatus Liptoniibacteriota TaxID=1817909 RepID=A0A1G2CN24_9BACT|nr:MAG: hypothetical protein A3E09_00140 [Candidatus Liptonbacteria bacterium RIFCSPHIGHO2_12_FULL_60_13]OGZ02783.1 MAG: hypothetical protein A3G64_01040 [Candidatus Liptonbacteria bacterium RIFCSPLOWO2_12_FULL_60_15]